MKHARRSPATRRLAAALATLVCLPAFATPPLVTLVFRDGGEPVLNVTDAHGLTLVDETLGLRTTDADLTRDLRLVATSQRAITERYRMTVGKRLERSANLSETRYALQNAKGQKLDVVVRVANDGVAFRYELPGVALAGGLKVDGFVYLVGGIILLTIGWLAAHGVSLLAGVSVAIGGVGFLCVSAASFGLGAAFGKVGSTGLTLIAVWLLYSGLAMLISGATGRPSLPLGRPLGKH